MRLVYLLIGLKISRFGIDGVGFFRRCSGKALHHGEVSNDACSTYVERMSLIIMSWSRTANRVLSGRNLHEELRSVEGKRLNLEETLKAVVRPPVQREKIPRVEHFLSAFTGSAVSVVAETLELPESFVHELVRFGAIYSCPVIPDTAPSTSLLSSEIQKEIQCLKEEARTRVGRNPIFQKPRRVEADAIIFQNSYFRVHVHPKRFPAYYEVEWASRILLDGPHCIAVNKPAGCQVPPRVDNRIECLTQWIADLKGWKTELKPVHRLDTGTEGVVILAKTLEFTRYFQKLMKKGGMRKSYRALTAQPPPKGVLKHYIRENHHTKGQRRRSQIFSDPTEGTVFAELEIMKTRKVELSEKARSVFGRGEGFESKIELKTGRTHQIRIQLAQEGCPLLGDGLYGSEEEKRNDVSSSCDECIGLQAAKLELRDDNLATFFPNGIDDVLSVSAGKPWWREQ